MIISVIYAKCLVLTRSKIRQLLLPVHKGLKKKIDDQLIKALAAYKSHSSIEKRIVFSNEIFTRKIPTLLYPMSKNTMAKETGRTRHRKPE